MAVAFNLLAMENPWDTKSTLLAKKTGSMKGLISPLRNGLTLSGLMRKCVLMGMPKQQLVKGLS